MDLRESYNRYLKGDLDREELTTFLDQMQEDEATAFALMDESWEDLEQTDAELNRLRRTKVRRMWIIRSASAAAAVLILTIGGYFILNKDSQEKQPIVAKARVKYDVAPGRKGSVLKLAGLPPIALDTARFGLIARQGTVEVYKNADGSISYKGKSDANTVLYNEIITTKAEEQEVELPDGSFVTLNASSSVRYPLAFTGNQRLISGTGELYCRVLHDEKRPFRVQVKDQLIDDIGTEFNINAYDEEHKVVTTVAEGVVAVSKKQNRVTVKAGQQVETTENNDKLNVEEANLKTSLAWYKGYFRYDHADIPAVMKQIERWYDVKVKYEGTVPNETFTGAMSRKINLSEAMEVLKSIGIRYRLEENKTIVILP